MSKKDIKNNEIEEVKSEVKNNVEEPKSSNGLFDSFGIKKKKVYVFTITCALLLIIFLVFGIFACINKFNNNVYSNISILDMDVSGKSSQDLIELLNNMQNDIDNLVLSVYQDNNEIYKITADEINFKIDVAATIKEVMEIGRNSNIFKNTLDIIKVLVNGKVVTPVCTYDNSKLEDIMKNIDLSLNNRMVLSTYNIDEQNKKIIITNGKSGNTIKYDVEKDKIISAFTYLNSTSIKLDAFNEKPNLINIDEMYNNIKRDAKDAYIDENTKPAKIVSEVVGIDMDKEGLRKLFEIEENKSEGKIIEYNLTITNPNIRSSDISYNYYNDKLAGKTTYFDIAQKERCNNMEIALQYLNAKVIMPGETFSYNNAIGETTSAKGYQEAPTFKGNLVVDELGGGICQTSSTLYQAALLANLDVVERYQHGLPVGYVQPSLDATVYSPLLDLKIKNTRNYPVKIVTSYSSSGSMNISIFGTKENEEYEVSLTSNYIEKIPYNTKYIYDETLENGQQVVISSGVDGYISEGYITKKLNGNVISNTLLSRDTYNAKEEIIKVGTKDITESIQ